MTSRPSSPPPAEPIKMRVSDTVPRDEVWFVKSVGWECHISGATISVVERLKLLGKIINAR